MSDDLAKLNQLLSSVYHLNVERGIPLTIIYVYRSYPAIVQGIYQYPFLTEEQKSDYNQAVELELADCNSRLQKIDSDDLDTRQYRCVSDIDKVLKQNHAISKFLGLELTGFKTLNALKTKRHILNRMRYLEKNIALSSDPYQYICIITRSFINEFRNRLHRLERCVAQGQLNITCTTIDPVFAEYLHAEKLTPYDPDRNDMFFAKSLMPVLAESNIALISDDESEDKSDVIVSPSLESIQEPSTKVSEVIQINDIHAQLQQLKDASVMPSKSAWRREKQVLIDSLFMESLKPKLGQNMQHMLKQLALLQRKKRTFQLHMPLFQEGPTKSFSTACELIMGTSALMNTQRQLYPLVHQCIFGTLKRYSYDSWDIVIKTVVDELKLSVYGIAPDASSYISEDEFSEDALGVSPFSILSA